MLRVQGFNFGGVWGLKQSVTGTIYADFYGRKHLGAIQSIDSTCNIVGTAIGPLLITAGQAYFGNFQAVLLILGCFPLVSGLMALLFLKKPPPPKEAREREGAGSVYEKGGGHRMVELRTRGGEVVKAP